MKKKLLVILSAIGILTLIGVSYALWVVSYSQTGTNDIATGCFSMSLTNEKNNIELKNSYPITDADGEKLTPYSFTITNTCDLFASYTVKLEMLAGSNLPIQYIRSMVNKEEIKNLNELETSEKSVSSSTDSRVLAKGSLGSGDSEDYTLRLWLDENVTLNDTDAIGKILKSKVVVTGTVSTFSPCEQGFCKLNEALLVNEYQTTNLDAAKEKIQNKQTVDLTKTAPIIEWQEDHGTTLETETTNTNNYIGTSYRFNSETGYYDVLNYGTDTDYKYYTEISNEEYQAHDYYTCIGSQSVNDQGDISYWRPKSCATLYKIISAENYQEGSETRNKIKGYAYTQQELESDKSDKGLYQAADDHGTSYYYRGSVKNNNVKFGSTYWQIIRINGDGSIRLLYNGTVPNATGSQKQIDTSVFNNEKNSPAYIGYMYGNTINSSYAENTKNEQSSTMKYNLDTWYQTNIVNKNLQQYIADPGFCNSREIIRGDGVSLSISTDYESYSKMKNPNTFSLICTNQERDLFTTSTATKGNKALTYPIGLITVDEVAHAGYVNEYVNKSTYIYSSKDYLTMTPFTFDFGNSTARIWNVNSSGTFSQSHVAYELGVRPVINLSKDVEITRGIGTSSDPFVIKTA